MSCRKRRGAWLQREPEHAADDRPDRAFDASTSHEPGDSSAYYDSNSGDDGVAKDAVAPATRQRVHAAAAGSEPTRRKRRYAIVHVAVVLFCTNVCLLVIVHRVADEFDSFDDEDEEDAAARRSAMDDAVRYCICSRPKWIAPMIVCKSKQRVCNGCVMSCVKYSV